MPRTRTGESLGLPAHLYAIRRRGKLYYQYRHPITGRCHGFGTDRDAAIRDAQALNECLLPQSRVIGTAPSTQTLGEYIEHYRTAVLPNRRVKGQALSEAYLRETDRILARINDALGGHRMNKITQGQIAAYLRGLDSADAHNQHRVRLIQIWRHAMSDEVVRENVAERVLQRDLPSRRRQRLTLEQLREILAAARPAIQAATLLSLNTLQRRTDVQRWRFDWQRDAHAHIIQSKTRKHGVSAWLRVPLSMPTVYGPRNTLGGLIEYCRDDIACPFVIHERPQRLKKPLPAGKEHPFQLTAPAISRGFAEARDRSGACEHIEAEARPTFHELISLGQHLRQQQGWTTEQIQRLRGHTSAGMTEHYQEGHTWTTVQIPGQ